MVKERTLPVRCVWCTDDAMEFRPDQRRPRLRTRKVIVVCASVVCLSLIIFAADGWLSASRSHGECELTRGRKSKRTVRALIKRVVDEGTVELVLQGRPDLADGSVMAEVPERLRGALAPGHLCVAGITDEGGSRTAEVLSPLRERGLLVLAGVFVFTVIVTNRLDEAIIAFWEVKGLAPEDGIAWRELAYLYTLRRWFVLADREVARALVLLSADSRTHYVAGVVKTWLGKHGEGETHLRESVRLDPGNADAREALETVFRE